MKLPSSPDKPADEPCKRLAAALRAQQTELSETLYQAVTDVACATWNAPPAFEGLQEWGRSQLLTAIDLLAARFETGDRLFLELFSGWVHSRLIKDLSENGAPEDYKPWKAIQLVSPKWTETLRPLAPGEEIRRLAEELDQCAASLSRPVRKAQRILFIGDCLQFEVMTSLLGPCAQAGIGMTQTLINERLQPVLRNKIRAFAPGEFDLVFFSPFSHSYLPEYEALLKPRSGLWGNARISSHVEPMLEEVFQTLDTITTHLDCPVCVHNTSGTIQLFGRASGLVKLLGSWRNRPRVRKLVNRGLKERIALRRESRVRLLDEDALRTAKTPGLGRVYINSHAFHPTRLGVELGRGPCFEAIYSHAFLTGKKVAVCDLDNTLWEGVIGEGAVRHYPVRQALLRDLRQRGVLLSIISKNDERNVHWTGAVLQPDDFVAPRINWDPKTSNMAQIRDELNLKLKDFVFLDDRADEIERMRNAFPEILAMDATEPATWRFLEQWRDSLPRDPDEDRTRLYRERAERERFVNGLPREQGAVEDETAAFMALELSVRISAVAPGGLKRAVELINRTNQFNVCGSRVTERDLAQGMGASRTVLQAEASDKFGSMGVVAIMQADWRGDRMEIPLFVLSCRAFGFGIEYALLNALSKVRPGDFLVAGYQKETQFNQICRQFYSVAGMKQDGGQWLAPVAELLPPPSWLTVEYTIRP